MICNEFATFFTFDIKKLRNKQPLIMLYKLLDDIEEKCTYCCRSYW